MRGAHGSANGAAAAEMCASTHFHNYSKLCHHHSRLPADTQIAPALYLLQTPERERRMAKLRTRAPRINALLLLLLCVDVSGCGFESCRTAISNSALLSLAAQSRLLWLQV